MLNILGLTRVFEARTIGPGLRSWWPGGGPCAYPVTVFWCTDLIRRDLGESEGPQVSLGGAGGDMAGSCSSFWLVGRALPGPRMATAGPGRPCRRRWAMRAVSFEMRPPGLRSSGGLDGGLSRRPQFIGRAAVSISGSASGGGRGPVVGASNGCPTLCESLVDNQAVGADQATTPPMCCAAPGGEAVLPQWVPSSAVATCFKLLPPCSDTLPFYCCGLAAPVAGGAQGGEAGLLGAAQMS